MAANDDAAADAGAEDDPENDLGAVPGAIDGFGKGKAVGIVGQADFALQQSFEVGAQRAADQAGRVGVLDPPVRQRFGAGNADADRAAPAQLGFRRRDQSTDGS